MKISTSTRATRANCRATSRIACSISRDPFSNIKTSLSTSDPSASNSSFPSSISLRHKYTLLSSPLTLEESCLQYENKRIARLRYFAPLTMVDPRHQHQRQTQTLNQCHHAPAPTVPTPTSANPPHARTTSHPTPPAAIPSTGPQHPAPSHPCPSTGRERALPTPQSPSRFCLLLTQHRNQTLPAPEARTLKRLTVKVLRSPRYRSLNPMNGPHPGPTLTAIATPVLRERYESRSLQAREI